MVCALCKRTMTCEVFLSTEPVFSVNWYFLQTDPCLEVGILDDFVQWEPILASSRSNSGPKVPFIEREDLRSSTYSTISTSSIQSIASEGNCELVHTTVLNMILKQANVAWCKEFVEMKIWNVQSLFVFPMNIWRVSPTRDERIFDWRSRLASLISIDSIPGDMVLKKTLLDLQKRFPIYQVCSKCLAPFLRRTRFAYGFFRTCVYGKGLSWQQTFLHESDKLAPNSLVYLAPEWTMVKIAFLR